MVLALMTSQGCVVFQLFPYLLPGKVVMVLALMTSLVCMVVFRLFPSLLPGKVVMVLALMTSQGCVVFRLFRPLLSLVRQGGDGACPNGCVVFRLFLPCCQVRWCSDCSLSVGRQGGDGACRDQFPLGH